jgi:4-amino-4-deoxy-L-arabinose transferase-like glycosyltransferase
VDDEPLLEAEVVVEDGPTLAARAWAFCCSPAAVLALVLLATLLLKLRHLDHSGLTRWDEVFHAIVGRNLLKHPLKPTLFDTPYLPYDFRQWKENHVWLHKPILPLWQIALSFRALGTSTFALRLPSVLLSTAAAWLTYLIGKELLDRQAAFIAATLQAANPFLLSLVQGYQFADHVDVTLLFWVEVGVYFLFRARRTGSWCDVVLAGLAQGLAYLSKSYLAVIILGLALTAWLLPVFRLTRREDCRIGPARILALLGVSVLTALPWVAYCATSYPQEFWYEHAQVWKHLNSNVETWAAPWDRLVFDYLIAMHGVFYTPILAASLVLLGTAFRRRHAGLWLLYAWSLGVLLPHLFAVTKTPSATLIAMPPLLLLLGDLIAEAWRGERGPLVALTAVLALGLAVPAVVKNPGYGFPAERAFGAVMRQSLWALGHLAGALTAVVLAAAGAGLLRKRFPADAALWYYLRGAALMFCACGLCWFGIDTVRADWRVTGANASDPSSVALGEFARDNLPDNAVLLCEEDRPGGQLTILFYANRTSYPRGHAAWDETARRIVKAGGVPYVVTRHRLALPAVYSDARHGLLVYLWPEWRVPIAAPEW